MTARGQPITDSDVAVRVRCNAHVLRGVMTDLRRMTTANTCDGYRAISDLRDSLLLIIGA